MTRTTRLGLCGALIAISVGAYACGSLGDASSLGGRDNEPVGKPGADGAATPSNVGPVGPDLTPVDNAVILVHAAKAQSFRLCFEKEGDRLPQPDSQVMPEANVVGVEVGSAVRLGPLRGAPGKVLLFDEPLIRVFYPAFGGPGSGATCDQLIANPKLGALAVNLGAVTTDLSKGVHLLVVKGCQGDTQLRTFSTAECGADWTSAKGNLRVQEITLPGAKRPSEGILPAQVVNLSQPLEGIRGSRNLVVSFGDLGMASGQQVVVTNPPLFPTKEQNSAAQLAYTSSDIAIYETVGFRVSLVDPSGGGDGGARTVVLDESLARIQKLSSPRDVPPSYYSAASNYALLLLGDPEAKLPDGGPDNDDRRNIHLLAVPVIEPKGDGGTDGGSGEPQDGGAAPSP